MKTLIILLSFTCLSAHSQLYVEGEDTRVFSGRISKINPIAKLVRVKINFENAKFLTKNSRVQFWSESTPNRKCLGYLRGRTSDYLLLSVPDYNICLKRVHFATGSYLHLMSENLDKNLTIARELIEILHKKRMALGARVKRYSKEISGHESKMDLVNKRYEILQEKLKLEWKKEISDLKTDEIEIFSSYKHAKNNLEEVEFKLQQYRVRDQNLIEDRWSLDPNLYYKK